jgi:hypothetical protein
MHSDGVFLVFFFIFLQVAYIPLFLVPLFLHMYRQVPQLHPCL